MSESYSNTTNTFNQTIIMVEEEEDLTIEVVEMAEEVEVLIGIIKTITDDLLQHPQVTS